MLERLIILQLDISETTLTTSWLQDERTAATMAKPCGFHWKLSNIRRPFSLKASDIQPAGI